LPAEATMSRKHDSHASNSRSAAALKSLRSQVDKLDLQILKLVNERASVAGEIVKLKKEEGSDAFNPAREEEVLQNLAHANRGPLDDATVRAIYREIMSGARALERVPKISCLGPEFSYSHLAAVERFGQAVEYTLVGSIPAVFEDVNRGHTEHGVVPLENSTDGRVADTLECLLRLPQLKISAEIRLRIHHNLLANCEQAEIRRVYSKGQALSQCRNWISKNVPHAAIVEVSSTANAARLAQTEPGAAAVASRQAAVRYGLRILNADIEDHAFNETRFAVIGHNEAKRTGHDKTAVVFRVGHEPGALADALNVFKQQKINLTWIESFPSHGEKPEYVFFADFDGHMDDSKPKKALELLEKRCEKVTVLGSFPMAKVRDE
jgi:chorismate mutase/prephenate dehydratase